MLQAVAVAVVLFVPLEDIIIIRSLAISGSGVVVVAETTRGQMYSTDVTMCVCDHIMPYIYIYDMI